MKTLKSNIKSKSKLCLLIVLIGSIIAIGFGILLDVSLLPNNIFKHIVMIESNKYHSIITTVISIQGSLVALFFAVITLTTCFYGKQLFGSELQTI